MKLPEFVALDLEGKRLIANDTLLGLLATGSARIYQMTVQVPVPVPVLHAKSAPDEGMTESCNRDFWELLVGFVLRVQSMNDENSSKMIAKRFKDSPKAVLFLPQKTSRSDIWSRTRSFLEFGVFHEGYRIKHLNDPSSPRAPKGLLEELKRRNIQVPTPPRNMSLTQLKKHPDWESS